MNMELRQWAIEKAIAAGTDCFAVTAIAAQILAFVDEPKEIKEDAPIPRAKYVKIADYEAAFDAGEKPFFAAKRLGVHSLTVSAAYTRIRRARGVPPVKNGNSTFKRKNGAAHS